LVVVMALDMVVALIIIHPKETRLAQIVYLTNF